LKISNHGLKLIFLLGFFSLMSSTAFAGVACDKWRPTERSIEDRVSWDIDIRGLINVSFDTDKDGKIDFIETYRQSKQDYGISTPSTTPEEMKKRFPDFLIISAKSNVILSEDSNYMPSPSVGILDSRSERGKQRYSHYVLIKHPIYYTLDRDEDARHEVIIYDAEEDGVNGNETIEYCAEQKTHYIENPEENVDGKKKEYEIKWPDLDKAVEDGSSYMDK